MSPLETPVLVRKPLLPLPRQHPPPPLLIHPTKKVQTTYTPYVPRSKRGVAAGLGLIPSTPNTPNMPNMPDLRPNTRSYVEANLLDWFDLKEFKVYKWLQANTLERLHPKSESLPADKQIWKEREDAERGIQAYLSDLPSTVTFVHGPQGSGKSTMIVSALKSAERKSLVIDCRELSKASMNNLIDLASVAGLSRSLGEQLQQILDSVALALRNVSEKQHKDIAKNVQTREHDKPAEQFDKAERSRNEGSQNEKGNTPEIDQKQAQESPASSTKTRKKKEKDSSEIQAVEALPIVVIRNFAGKAVREDLLNGLAQWATKLAENQIAHVIVISDNPLQSKPLNFVALYDADEASALASVGLESLINKVRTGMDVKEAVDDIISRGVGELRKNAFGDDAEDAKNLPWTRGQAWTLLDLLSKNSEVPYHQVLLGYPFKGDEAPLRSMEHAELIMIATHDGEYQTNHSSNHPTSTIAPTTINALTHNHAGSTLGFQSVPPSVAALNSASAALLSQVRALDALPRIGSLRSLDLRGNEMRFYRLAFFISLTVLYVSAAWFYFNRYKMFAKVCVLLAALPAVFSLSLDEWSRIKRYLDCYRRRFNSTTLYSTLSLAVANNFNLTSGSPFSIQWPSALPPNILGFVFPGLQMPLHLHREPNPTLRNKLLPRTEKDNGKEKAVTKGKAKKPDHSLGQKKGSDVKGKGRSGKNAEVQPSNVFTIKGKMKPRTKPEVKTTIIPSVVLDDEDEEPPSSIGGMVDSPIYPLQPLPTRISSSPLEFGGLPPKSSSPVVSTNAQGRIKGVDEATLTMDDMKGDNKIYIEGQPVSLGKANTPAVTEIHQVQINVEPRVPSPLFSEPPTTAPSPLFSEPSSRPDVDSKNKKYDKHMKAPHDFIDGAAPVCGESIKIEIILDSPQAIETESSSITSPRSRQPDMAASKKPPARSKRARKVAIKAGACSKAEADASSTASSSSTNCLVPTESRTVNFSDPQFPVFNDDDDSSELSDLPEDYMDEEVPLKGDGGEDMDMETPPQAAQSSTATKTRRKTLGTEISTSSRRKSLRGLRSDDDPPDERSASFPSVQSSVSHGKSHLARSTWESKIPPSSFVSHGGSEERVR
ncbi:RNA12 protein-domain-containing protein [Lentinula guzmanii]|uniref:Mitochondrial escape protein 2 n=1 Tax=Lentinula guzmanii TaxID=2804957 RepID=A0AA38J9Q3_9AGAR|nr:RNA12 protein-domain-containing protein [Lentinula guzmanii]